VAHGTWPAGRGVEVRNGVRQAMPAAGGRIEQTARGERDAPRWLCAVRDLRDANERRGVGERALWSLGNGSTEPVRLRRGPTAALYPGALCRGLAGTGVARVPPRNRS